MEDGERYRTTDGSVRKTCNSSGNVSSRCVARSMDARGGLFSSSCTIPTIYRALLPWFFLIMTSEKKQHAHPRADITPRAPPGDARARGCAHWRGAATMFKALLDEHAAKQTRLKGGSRCVPGSRRVHPARDARPPNAPRPAPSATVVRSLPTTGRLTIPHFPSLTVPRALSPIGDGRGEPGPKPWSTPSTAVGGRLRPSAHRGGGQGAQGQVRQVCESHL